jgi:flagellar assembly factor FliW
MAPVGDAPGDGPTELHFPAGLPGFPAAHRFSLTRWGGEDSPFSLLQSTEVDGLAFVVAHPLEFFPEYAPEVDDDTVERLGLADADDALVLVIVTVPDDVRAATANLAGPVIVNRRTLEAAQAVLADVTYDLRTPLVPA